MTFLLAPWQSGIPRRSSSIGTEVERKRQFAAVTTSRADFGLFQPVLERISEDAALDLRLMVSGAHFSPVYGSTVHEIERLQFSYERGLEMRLDSDTPEAISKSLGVGVLGFAQSFAVNRPDLLMVIGDRIEMLCAAVAAIPFNIPIAHLYGGKVTEGAIDELARHALTKMSHLHFVTTKRHAQRVIQMGEESWRVFNYGSPGLDRIHKYGRMAHGELCREFDLSPERPFVLVTFHPITLEPLQLGAQLRSLLDALARTDVQLVITYPNADAGSGEIIDAWEDFARDHTERVRLIKNAGPRRYFDLMASAAAMIGNSSSGIAEAPSFQLPVVNIGTRQTGFERAGNVIDVGYSADEIVAAIEKALSPVFRTSLKGIVNPYGDGHSSARIVQTLRSIPLDDRLLRKKFVDQGTFE
jgi:UDP-hydrolysing UDP-N-acetyl-D-glucosamine 2-epimerase